MSKSEKKQIIRSIPNLSQKKIDTLIQIFENEKAQFAALDMRHISELRALESRHALEWEEIEGEYENHVT